MTAEPPLEGVACTLTQVEPPSPEPSNWKVPENVPAKVAPTVFHFGSITRNRQAVVEVEGWQVEACAVRGAVTIKPDCPKTGKAAKNSSKSVRRFMG